MGDWCTTTSWREFNSAINAFRRDLYQGYLNHQNTLGVIEDRLWDIWPEGRDVDLVRSKIQEARNFLDAVWNECDGSVTQNAWKVFDKWEQVYVQEEQEREEQREKERQEKEIERQGILDNKPTAAPSMW